jgi:hypothetical protein
VAMPPPVQLALDHATRFGASLQHSARAFTPLPANNHSKYSAMEP